MICPYCGSEKTEILYECQMPTIITVCEKSDVDHIKSKAVTVSLCESCGLGFNSTPLSDEDIAEIYEKYIYIKPGKNIGISKYPGMLKLIQRNASCDDFLVEIGSSDGYLIDSLIDQGYANIQGFEPSQEWKNMKNQDHVRNEFFTKSTVFPQNPDVFYLMHVLEHFSKPWDMLELMRDRLSEKGKIIFEVPNFCGVYHQHLVYFSSPFVHRLAHDMGFNVIEEESTDIVLRCVLGVDKTPETLAKDLKNRWDGNKEDLERLRKAIAQAENVFWWATGSTSIITLDTLGEKVCKGKNFVFIDSDGDRKDKALPIKFLKDYPIMLPSEALPKMGPRDLLVIASMFSDEILKSISDMGYKIPDNVISHIRTI